MIKLTRFQGKEFCLNSDLIMTVEKTPDTVITLINGVKIVVQEDIDMIIEKVKVYRQEINCPHIIRSKA